MIDTVIVDGITVAVYAVAFAILAARLRQHPDRQGYLAPVVAVVGLSGVSTALSIVGLGTVSIGGTPLDAPTLAVDLFTYAVLWTIAARLGGASGRLLLAVAAIPVVNRVAFELTYFVGGIGALVCIAAVVVGHIAVAYLFIGPVWRGAESLPNDRRVLHWKARNLLLFLIGMLIAFAVLAVAGLFSEFGTLLITDYLYLLTRVGFAGFLLANVDAVPSGGLDDVFRPGSAVLAAEQSGAPAGD